MDFDQDPKLNSVGQKAFFQGVTKAKVSTHPQQHPSKGPTVALEEEALGPTVAQLEQRTLNHSFQSSSTCLKDLVLKEETWWGDTPLCQRLKVRLEWWTKNASHSVVDIIKNGIRPPWEAPPLVYPQSFKGSYQFGSSGKNIDRLSREWLHKSGERLKNSTFDPLVFNLKTRFRGGRKMEVNSRLQRVKPTLHTLPLLT